jgi:hypothetical protein
LHKAKKCLERANNCKWIEWTDLITNKENKWKYIENTTRTKLWKQVDIT